MSDSAQNSSAHPAAAAVLNRREFERNKGAIHMKRASAQIKLEHDPAQVITSRVLLNDLTPKGVGLFAVSPLLPGSQVLLTIDQPKQMFVKGRVVWCMEFDLNSHVLSEQKFRYRVGIQFQFASEEERQALAAYVQSLGQEFLYGSRAV